MYRTAMYDTSAHRVYCNAVVQGRELWWAVVNRATAHSDSAPIWWVDSLTVVAEAVAVKWQDDYRKMKWRNSGYHPVLLAVTTLYGVCRSTLSSSPLINKRCVVGNSDIVVKYSLCASKIIVVLNAFRFTSSSIFITTDTVWSAFCRTD
jgi:UDP-N-acetylmuramyl pentapeptide phosphotransferase/UDP-N-acetylglucosamine-1-phosphate transferase